MARDGSFYWVFAQITPAFDKNSRKNAYCSVRRKPNPKAIPVVADIYRQMLDEERRVRV